MFASIAYASPSAFNSTRERADLSIAASQTRPVSFHGEVVRNGFTLRVALRALGSAIWSEDVWDSEADFVSRILDPVITVHPDRLWFEAFSQDMSVYSALIVDPDSFRLEGTPSYGTTNIDFTAWLWGALDEMRTSRRTHFRVGAEGFEVSTSSAGGRFESKVDIPDAWVRGFLQVQGAMALPGTRLSVRAVDLLSAIRFLRFNKAKISPRALRYEMEPEKFAQLVIEPWDHVVPLEGATHGYTEKRVIRTWGRRRLRLIEPLLPFAERVDIYLKGRALPSFYAVKLPGMTFLLGLSSFGGEGGFGGSSGFDLTTPTQDNSHAPAVLSALAPAFHLSTAEVAQRANIPVADAARTLTSLSYAGRAMYDLEAQRWRYRELFDPPIDPVRFYPPDPRREAADRLLAQGLSDIEVTAEDARKARRYVNPNTGEKVERELVFRQWRIGGSCEGERTSIVVNAEERIIFGQCGCEFFKEHVMNFGPCAHMLALYQASAAQRVLE
ncbi:MAG TPA: hypothetical protein VGD45_02715 [Steroidobacter sp.]|uniref:hypothetical protein n=1 Tax=Steroidobacter sp. TaxID=1978227 RepID=UPI002ED7919E